MLLLTNCCLFILLITVVLQDLKYRHISWFLIPLLFCGFLIQGLVTLPTNELLSNICINISFVTIQFMMLTAYISIKNKKFVNIIDSYLGLGDVLFFVVLTTALSPINFIVFFIVSLFITLIAYIVYQLIIKRTTDIPLAGSMAALMIATLLVNQYIPSINLHNDVLITNWLLN